MPPYSEASALADRVLLTCLLEAVERIQPGSQQRILDTAATYFSQELEKEDTPLYREALGLISNWENALSIGKTSEAPHDDEAPGSAST